MLVLIVYGIFPQESTVKIKKIQNLYGLLTKCQFSRANRLLVAVDKGGKRVLKWRKPTKTPPGTGGE